MHWILNALIFHRFRSGAVDQITKPRHGNFLLIVLYPCFVFQEANAYFLNPRLPLLLNGQERRSFKYFIEKFLRTFRPGHF